MTQKKNVILHFLCSQLFPHHLLKYIITSLITPSSTKYYLISIYAKFLYIVKSVLKLLIQSPITEAMTLCPNSYSFIVSLDFHSC